MKVASSFSAVPSHVRLLRTRFSDVFTTMTCASYMEAPWWGWREASLHRRRRVAFAGVGVL